VTTKEKTIDIPSGKEVEESGLPFNDTIDNLYEVLQLMIADTRNAVVEQLECLTQIEAFVIKNNNYVDVTDQSNTKVLKSIQDMKRLVDFYEAERSNIEKQIILNGVYLFSIWPKQIQIMFGMKRVPELNPPSTANSQNTTGPGTSKAKVIYSAVMKEGNVPSVGGFPGRAILTSEQRIKQAEAILEKDKNRDYPLFTLKNIKRLLSQDPGKQLEDASHDGIDGEECGKDLKIVAPTDMEGLDLHTLDSTAPDLDGDDFGPGEDDVKNSSEDESDNFDENFDEEWGSEHYDFGSEDNLVEDTSDDKDVSKGSGSGNGQRLYNVV
jgi:hypothetical protein